MRDRLPPRVISSAGAAVLTSTPLATPCDSGFAGCWLSPASGAGGRELSTEKPKDSIRKILAVTLGCAVATAHRVGCFSRASPTNGTPMSRLSRKQKKAAQLLQRKEQQRLAAQAIEVEKARRRGRNLHRAEFAFGTLLAVFLFVWTFVGPPWPTEPVFEPGAPSFGSAFDVTFNGTNKSAFFGIQNLRVSCTLVCFKLVGQSGAMITARKGANPNILGALGHDHLLAGETQPFACGMRRVFNIDGKDAADSLPNVAISFMSEYDNPWLFWLSRKKVQSGTFSLNTRTTPPQWVHGEIPGVCDF
jgi:hypothetical protein